MMNDKQNTNPAAATDPQGRMDELVSRFAAFVDGVEHSVDRAEEPHWCAVYLSAEDADDLLPAFREVLRRAHGV